MAHEVQHKQAKSDVRFLTSNTQLIGSNLEINQEKDLAVMVDSSLKTSTQCSVALKKTDPMLGTANKTSIASIVSHLNKYVMRTCLEYCV